MQWQNDKNNRKSGLPVANIELEIKNKKGSGNDGKTF